MNTVTDLLVLFLTFLKIGGFSFGGGYGMISLMREEVLAHGWLTEEEFLSFVAVSESTPGPLAVNMATFVGSTKGGLAGAAAATLGVVLPAFAVILVIAVFLRNFLSYPAVQGVLAGVRPCVVGLILATGLTMAFSHFLGVGKVGEFSPDWRAMIIFFILILTHFAFTKMRRKPPPIGMILFSAVLGMILYGVF